MTKKMNVEIGIIGYGYWGPNLVRNFVESPEASVRHVCDRDEKRLALVRRRYPHIRTTTDPADLFRDPELDAVAIATPISSHHALAMAALEAGKHVLVEKPLAASPAEAESMVAAAERGGLVLMVDHTFVYTSAVAKIRELISSGELGEILYYDSVRVNLGLFQHDLNVIWDLAVHDLSIMDHVLPDKPLSVSATGISHLPGQPQNIAYLTLFYPGNRIAHTHVNWLAPVKVRRTLIGGDRKMIVYDDLEPSEKIKLYDKGVSMVENKESIYKMLVDYRSGDIWTPHLNLTEALSVETAHFCRCVLHGEKPLTDGQAGVRVVRILDAATRSMEQQGKPVPLHTQEGR